MSTCTLNVQKLSAPAPAAVADALRLWCGVGRRYSIAAVSAATGISERTLKSYRSGDTEPGFSNFLALASALGPAFFNQCLRGVPFEVRATDSEETTPQELLSGVCEFSAALARALVDGRIDHRERPELLEAVRDLQHRLTSIAMWMEGQD